ncbi:YdcF family protein [candidate division CSSED10-310 bacterium]|uniref:YdcF family protein n=1 Tax=candidate division CSSED10-310 bacterium TaxID=2855610 RepID=A0ABV6Z640_UNCC1
MSIPPEPIRAGQRRVMNHVAPTIEELLTPKGSSRITPWTIMILILVSIAVVACFHNQFLLGLGGLLVVSDDLDPADLIHILGGGFDRLDYGFSLYQQGYAPRFFVTGSDDALVYTAYLLKKGVRPEHIRPRISWSKTTWQEARELQQYLAQTPAIKSVIVVSQPYQMRRARFTFQKVLANRVTLQFSPVPFETARYQRVWWQDPGSRTTVYREYYKLLYYHLKY